MLTFLRTSGPTHLFVIGSLLGLAGCDSGQGRGQLEMAGAPSPEAERRMVASDQMTAQKASNPYLALEHYFRIEQPEDSIRERFEATVKQCGQPDFYGCTLIDASLNEDDYYVSANIQVRIRNQGVSPLVATAAEDGEITSQNSRAEDLTEAVMDVDKRLEMLHSYRERLQALEARAGDDVESLIKVSSELARVQSEIEHVQGNRDHLQKRLDLDLLNIQLYADSQDDFLAPIAQAFDRFLYHLASGASSIVIAIAWTLPWLLALFLLFFAFRLFRRRRRR